MITPDEAAVERVARAMQAADQPDPSDELDWYLPLARAALAAAPAPGDAWQPIETAPVARTVLLWMVATDDGEQLGHDIGWREEKDDVWCLVQHNGDPAISARPTHWQPLPAPPPARQEK